MQQIITIPLLILLTFSHQCLCIKFAPPMFTQSTATQRQVAEKLSVNEWLLTSQGDVLECKFFHDPIQVMTDKKTKKMTVQIDMTSKNHDKKHNNLRLRFKQVLDKEESVDQPSATLQQQQLKNRTLVDVPIHSETKKYFGPDSDLPHVLHSLQASILINTLELSKSKVYACCVEEAVVVGSSKPSCAILRLDDPSKSQNVFSYYQVLYKVIIVLLIAIFVLLLTMLLVCVHVSDLDQLMWSRRRPRASIRSPSSPQLFTVSVPGQASMPKLNLVSTRGDLYDRYNINANVTVVDENETSGECLPPPPYSEFVANINSPRH